MADPAGAPLAKGVARDAADPFGATQRQTTQRRQWQRLFGGSVLQLKPLAKDHLNVVGERHAISDLRREQEKAVVVAATHPQAGYWKEPEFNFGDAGGQASTGVAHGDSFVLGLANLVHAIEQAAKGVMERLPQADDAVLDPDAEKQLHTGFFNLRQGVDQIGPRLNAARKALLTSNRPNAVAVSQAMDGLDELARSCEPGEWRTVDLDLALLRYTQRHYGQARAILDRRADEWTFPNLGRLATQIGGTQDMSAAGKERSRHMHEAAKARAHLRGAWKVGNSHAEDLLEIRARDREGTAYELLSADEFQSEYGAHLPPVPDAAVIDGGRQFKWARHTLVGVLRRLAESVGPVDEGPGGKPGASRVPDSTELIASLHSTLAVAVAAFKKSARESKDKGEELSDLLRKTINLTQLLEKDVERKLDMAKIRLALQKLAALWEQAPP